MSEALPQPQTIGELLDSGFKLFRQSWKQLLPLTAPYALIMTLPQILLGMDAGKAMMQHGGYVAAGYLVFLVLATAINLAMSAKLDDIHRNANRLSIMDALAIGLSKTPTGVGSALAALLAIAVGMVLLLVPGIILMGSLSMSFFAILFEDYGAIGALNRSRELVRGNWFRSASALTVAMLIYTLPSLLMNFINGFILGLKGIATMTSSSPLFIATTIIHAICVMFLMPVLYSVWLVTFRDLQIRKSGNDLAARIASAA